MEDCYTICVMIIISTIAAAVSAIAAAVAAIATWRLWRQEVRGKKQRIDAGRPSFMIDLNRVEILEHLGYIHLKLPLTNFGQRPAVNCVSELKLWQVKEGASKVILSRSIDLPQTIYPGSDFVWREKIRTIDEKMTEYRLICGIRYYGRILEQEFCDFLVRSWPRGPDGKCASYLEIPTNNEYQHFLSMFSNEMRKYIDVEYQSPTKA